MSRIRSKDTRPEMLVRKLLHHLGYRFRLHCRSLPGSPDIIFPGKRKAIWVHGCFWHAHSCPVGARIPKTNVEYWAGKRAKNADRDRRALADLQALGWGVLVLWECEINSLDSLAARFEAFLGPRVPGTAPARQ